MASSNDRNLDFLHSCMFFSSLCLSCCVFFSFLYVAGWHGIAYSPHESCKKQSISCKKPKEPCFLLEINSCYIETAFTAEVSCLFKMSCYERPVLCSVNRALFLGILIYENFSFLPSVSLWKSWCSRSNCLRRLSGYTLMPLASKTWLQENVSLFGIALDCVQCCALYKAAELFEEAPRILEK